MIEELPDTPGEVNIHAIIRRAVIQVSELSMLSFPKMVISDTYME